MTSLGDLQTVDTARTGGDRKAQARMVAAAAVGVLLTLAAVLNSQSVRVHVIVSTVNMPLIVVIAMCTLPRHAHRVDHRPPPGGRSSPAKAA